MSILYNAACSPALPTELGRDLFIRGGRWALKGVVIKDRDGHPLYAFAPFRRRGRSWLAPEPANPSQPRFDLPTRNRTIQRDDNSSLSHGRRPSVNVVLCLVESQSSNHICRPPNRSARVSGPTTNI